MVQEETHRLVIKSRRARDNNSQFKAMYQNDSPDNIMINGPESANLTCGWIPKQHAADNQDTNRCFCHEHTHTTSWTDSTERSILCALWFFSENDTKPIKRHTHSLPITYVNVLVDATKNSNNKLRRLEAKNANRWSGSDDISWRHQQFSRQRLTISTISVTAH